MTDSMSIPQSPVWPGLPGAPHAPTTPTDERLHFLSEADCRQLLARLTTFAERGTGAAGSRFTRVFVSSTWTGNVRWARNQISTSGETLDNRIELYQEIDGACGYLEFNDTTDEALMAAVRRAERLAVMETRYPNGDLIARLPLEEMASPKIFSEPTYQLSAEQRAEAALALCQRAHVAGMLSAGYIEVAAVGLGLLDTTGRVRYVRYTQAQYSVTVRDPQGTGSGWAGVDWYDWQKIDAAALTDRALDKCLQSRNPVGIEPGRYTTILEPQATADLVGRLVNWEEGPDHLCSVSKEWSSDPTNQPPGPFVRYAGPAVWKKLGRTRIGDKIADERVTIGADPMDPDLGFVPFNPGEDYLNPAKRDVFAVDVYHPATWIKNGVLTNLSYNRVYGIDEMHENTGLPNSGALRMSGGPTSVAEMIATTKRGLLVTRFDNIVCLDPTSQLYRGFTRDGLWLVENGKISKAVKNLVFTESPLFILNNLEQLGPPERVFHPGLYVARYNPQPMVVPPLKVRDFSFTALADAV